MSTRQKAPARASELGQMLIDAGFGVSKKSQGEKPVILELRRDLLHVRLADKERPWETVYEKELSGHTAWYMDLPLDLANDRKVTVILALLA